MLEVVLGTLLIELEEVPEVLVLMNVLDIGALDRVPTEVKKPVLEMISVDFAMVEVLVKERAEELALKVEELDETPRDPPDNVVGELTSEE